MNFKTLDTAISEAKRFLSRAESLREGAKTEDECLQWVTTNRKRGEVRRASMDLTRALADLRRHD